MIIISAVTGSGAQTSLKQFLAKLDTDPIVDGKCDVVLRQNIKLQLSIQAVNAVIRVGTSDGAKQLLATPKNRPYYRQFAKAKF